MVGILLPSLPSSFLCSTSIAQKGGPGGSGLRSEGGHTG